MSDFFVLLLMAVITVKDVLAFPVYGYQYGKQLALLQ
jgi:hypothetical protein